MKDCKHLDFEARVNVTRLVEKEGDENPTGYMAEVKIKCVLCGLPFEFVGMPVGVDFINKTPMVSFGNEEARLPIRPSTDPAEQLKAMQ